MHVEFCSGQLYAVMQYSACKNYKYDFRECFFIVLLGHSNSVISWNSITIKPLLLAYPCYVYIGFSMNDSGVIPLSRRSLIQRISIEEQSYNFFY